MKEDTSSYPQETEKRKVDGLFQLMVIPFKFVMLNSKLVEVGQLNYEACSTA